MGAALWGQRASVSWVSEGRAGGSGWKVEEEGDGIKQSPGEGTGGRPRAGGEPAKARGREFKVRPAGTRVSPATLGPTGAAEVESRV